MILVPLIPYWLGEMLHQCHQEICQQGTRNTAIREASYCRLEIFVGEFSLKDILNLEDKLPIIHLNIAKRRIEITNAYAGEN